MMLKILESDGHWVLETHDEKEGNIPFLKKYGLLAERT